MQVTYVFGQTGKGKTRHILEKYGYENIYRVTDYDHTFDGYIGQDVLVFEEFRSNLRISDMLNYLDGYPLNLPSRYYNKVAASISLKNIQLMALGKNHLKKMFGYRWVEMKSVYSFPTVLK